MITSGNLKESFSSPAEVHLWNNYWAMTTDEEESVSSREACKLSEPDASTLTSTTKMKQWLTIHKLTPLRENGTHPLTRSNLWGGVFACQRSGFRMQETNCQSFCGASLLPFAAYSCRNQQYCQQRDPEHIKSD